MTDPLLPIIKVEDLQFKRDISLEDFMVRMLTHDITLDQGVIVNSEQFSWMGSGTQCFQDKAKRYCLSYNEHVSMDCAREIASLRANCNAPFTYELYRGPGIKNRIVIGDISIHRTVVCIVRCLNMTVLPRCITCRKPAHNFMAEEVLYCVPPPNVLQFGRTIKIDPAYRAALYAEHPHYNSEEIIGTFFGNNTDGFPSEDDWKHPPSDETSSESSDE